ncbi:MAG TPA: hypothetical protein VFI70_11405, partial [Nitrososphaeraceae archaeon]|nr:hypothetical protein [Nitrososphaeraceae archaeon]
EYHDTVIEPFLSDYEGTRAIKLSPGYNFKDPQSSILYYPTLMQSYVATASANCQFYLNNSRASTTKRLL